MPYIFSCLPTYRDIYYRVPSFLLELVDRSEYYYWYSKVVQPNKDNNIEPQEMYTVSFVKYFNISKEDFEKCNESRRAIFIDFRDRHGDDVSDEDPLSQRKRCRQYAEYGWRIGRRQPWRNIPTIPLLPLSV